MSVMMMQVRSLPFASGTSTLNSSPGPAGSVNLQYSAFTRHEAYNYKDHRFSASARNAKQTGTTVTDSFNRAAEDNIQKAAGDDPVFAAQMNTLVSRASTGIPINQFSGLIDLQQKNGCDMLSHSDIYQGYHAQRTCFVSTIIDEIDSKIKNSPFISLIID